jgi:hypothetical protein
MELRSNTFALAERAARQGGDLMTGGDREPDGEQRGETAQCGRRRNGNFHGT